MSVPRANPPKGQFTLASGLRAGDLIRENGIVPVLQCCGGLLPCLRGEGLDCVPSYPCRHCTQALRNGLLKPVEVTKR